MRKSIKPIVILISLILLIYVIYRNKDSQFQLITRIFNKNSDLDSLIAYTNEFIYAYVNPPLDYYYGSNLIPLALAALISPPGDFLELGMGLFSTPLLHKIARDQERHVISVDTDLEWMSKFIIYNLTSTHKLYHFGKIDEFMAYGIERDWALVLVDHSQMSKRAISAIAFAKKAQIVVAHDTETQNEQFFSYRRHRMTDYYKYVCKFTLFRPPNSQGLPHISTTLMSNFIDLEDVLSPAFQKIKTDFGHTACDKGDN